MSTISIIATVLNEAEAIDNLVRTLLLQSLQPIEIVIVDGGSTDGTWEKLEALANASPRLRAIRDESCNLKRSPGPIARGRNVAIASSRGEIIACCDAGCAYGTEWLARLTAPITSGRAEYALGGSAIESSTATAWDLAAAPLMGIAIQAEGVRKSCTARSMAFTRALWERVGGFPEETLLGEDTVFDQRVQKLARPAYAENAMALYAPRFNFRTAAGTLARYSAADGALGIRIARFLRMIARCLLQVGVVVLLRWSVIPLLFVLALEIFFALERDRSVLAARGRHALLPRLVFSAVVPWITAFNYLRGRITRANRPNPQNA